MWVLGTELGIFARTVSTLNLLIRCSSLQPEVFPFTSRPPSLLTQGRGDLQQRENAAESDPPRPCPCMAPAGRKDSMKYERPRPLFLLARLCNRYRGTLWVPPCLSARSTCFQCYRPKPLWDNVIQVAQFIRQPRFTARSGRSPGKFQRQPSHGSPLVASTGTQSLLHTPALRLPHLASRCFLAVAKERPHRVSRG